MDSGVEGGYQLNIGLLLMGQEGSTEMMGVGRAQGRMTEIAHQLRGLGRGHLHSVRSCWVRTQEAAFAVKSLFIAQPFGPAIPGSTISSSQDRFQTQTQGGLHSCFSGTTGLLEMACEPSVGRGGSAL